MPMGFLSIEERGRSPWAIVVIANDTFRGGRGLECDHSSRRLSVAKGIMYTCRRVYPSGDGEGKGKGMFRMGQNGDECSNSPSRPEIQLVVDGNGGLRLARALKTNP